jgi:PhnB protein
MASHQQLQIPQHWPGGATPRNPPQPHASIDAWLISRDTDAEVRFLTNVLGAVETPGSRVLDPDGDIGHVVVEIGDIAIMLFDAKPPWPAIRAHLRVYVGDVVSAVERAVAAGARVVTRPTLLASGERVARVRDLQGHLWWLREQAEHVAPGELGSRCADPAAQEAMAYVQRTLREELATAHGPITV